MSARPVAWIVGAAATDGIGASVALRFAQAGYRVALTGRRAGSIEALASTINGAGGRAVPIIGDATNEAQVVEMACRVAALGPLEFGVYNAGNNRRLPLMDMASADFEAMWRVVCLGAFVTGRAMLKPMIAAGRGTLVFTGATASLRGRPKHAAFSSAKAGMRMLAQAFAREVGPLGVHVAHVIVDGRVADADTSSAFTGDAIAQSYWALHAQPRGAWSQEIDLRSAEEPF